MEHWASLEEWEKWNHRVQGWKRSEDIRYELFEIKYAGSSLAKITKETDSISELEEQLWKYADQVFDFYHPYYKEEALEEIPIGLPDELSFATVRFTINEEITRQEIDYVVNCLKNDIAQLREQSEDYQNFL